MGIVTLTQQEFCFFLFFFTRLLLGLESLLVILKKSRRFVKFCSSYNARACAIHVIVCTFGACSRPLALGKMDTRSWSFFCTCSLNFSHLAKLCNAVKVLVARPELRGANRGTQTHRSVPFFTKSRDPPIFLFK